jgi:hypothetical protein
MLDLYMFILMVGYMLHELSQENSMHWLLLYVANATIICIELRSSLIWN